MDDQGGAPGATGRIGLLLWGFAVKKGHSALDRAVHRSHVEVKQIWRECGHDHRRIGRTMMDDRGNELE